ISGDTCGTGLDVFDAFWINVDGIGAGSSAHNTACANAVSQYGNGTNCYFFGGPPGTPLIALWLVLESEGRGDQVLFCLQAKATSVSGCTATLTTTDLTLATGVWNGTDIPRHVSLGSGTTVGIYIYTDGVGIGQSTFSAATPFGTLCLNGFNRSAPACAPATATTVGGVCNTSVLSTAVNCNGGALGIAVGEDVNVQLWYRDPTPANPGNANFSNAIFYTVQ
ncbi:MAG TPA: hypothetical protein VMT18_06215, partial [Planctomycetota bacterium]|nr:hypothetical protein [Planctomycetota bacterium]